MGACESAEARDAGAYTKHIDKQIEIDKELETMKRKLLLLGPGESGKSTCLKQMKILHHDGFSDSEIEEKKEVVFMNILQSMNIILEAMEKMGIPLADINLEHHARLIKKTGDSTANMRDFPIELKNAIKELWADQGVKTCFNKRSEYQVSDSAQYFFDHMDRIAEPKYKPNYQDILHTRVPTTGVVQVLFKFRGINFEVYDVGGQRSERRKWIRCFDNVHAIIFIVAISEYDQVLREDNKSNRLMEAIELFTNIVNSDYFKKASIILFLNKKDLFAEKILYTPLSVCFEGYKGEGYDRSIKHIRKRFEKCILKPNIKPYVHETCATDTTQVTVVINSVIDMIVQENLKDTGII